MYFNYRSQKIKNKEKKTLPTSFSISLTLTW